jgi:hypothetical protein
MFTFKFFTPFQPSSFAIITTRNLLSFFPSNHTDLSLLFSVV